VSPSHPHYWQQQHLTDPQGPPQIALGAKERCKAQAGWLEFNVPCQHKYGYIKDECQAQMIK